MKLLNKSICALVITVAILVMVSCSSSQITGDFHFSMVYGVEGKDFISTIDDTFIVDTVQGQKEIKLVLAEEDKELIKQKIIESSIIGEDFSFLKNTYAIVTPCEVCILKIEIDGRKYSFSWTSENMIPFSIDTVSNKVTVEEKYSEDYEKLKKLYEIKDYIVELIYKYPKIKQLPEHQMYE